MEVHSLQPSNGSRPGCILITKQGYRQKYCLAVYNDSWFECFGENWRYLPAKEGIQGMLQAGLAYRRDFLIQ